MIEVARQVEIRLNLQDIVEFAYKYALEAKREELAPYYWQRLRFAADMMKRTYDGGSVPDER